MEPWADDNTQNAGRVLAAERDAALAEVTRLRTLIKALIEIPAQHRDEFMVNRSPINWLHQAAPGMPLRIEIDAVRDTCDVLGHKLRDAVSDAVKSPCPTCGSPIRAVRLIPSPKASDYSGGTFNDPDYDPKFSNPCTDPWHDDTQDPS